MTPEISCNHVDAFLSGELAEEQRDQFRAHLASCTECREAVDEQQWIDRLLQSPLHAELEPAPELLADFIVKTATPARSRRKKYGIAWATAAAILIAAGWTIWHFHSRRSTDIYTSVQVTTGKDGNSPSRPPEQATFVSDGDAIAIPVESTSADVTIVQVYPTIDAERRWRSEIALQKQLLKSNGG